MGPEGAMPPGVLSVYITPDTCTAFNIAKPDNDEEGSSSWVPKEDVFKHISVNGKISDWYESRDFIKKVKDPETSFWLSTTAKR
jgi:hypothetical protein